PWFTWWRSCVCLLCLFGFDVHDREQRQAQIAHPPEQAVRRGLIDHRAGQERVAVAVRRDGQALEPGGPSRTQTALDPDLIDRRLAWVGCWFALVCHAPS